MKPSDKKNANGITRREALKYSGMALGGMVIGGNAMNAFASKKTPSIDDCNPNGCLSGSCVYPPGEDEMQRYTYFNELPPWNPKSGDPSNGSPETYIPPEINEM